MKTRCKQCIHKDVQATKYPCSECEEIQFKSIENEDHFSNASKNLTREEK